MAPPETKIEIAAVAANFQNDCTECLRTGLMKGPVCAIDPQVSVFQRTTRREVQQGGYLSSETIS
jgi:hypothetical protein